MAAVRRANTDVMGFNAVTAALATRALVEDAARLRLGAGVSIG
ncbi:MAG: hypothetical protein ACFB2Z_08135 [Maricaulaceae bacterium]